MSSEYDYFFKILLIGNKSGGKTSFISLYIGYYNDNFYTTIGVEYVRLFYFFLQKLKIIELFEKKIKLQIWDTGRVEKFKN